MRICAVEGCVKEGKSAGMCSGHYHRLKRYGDPLHVPPPKPVSKCSIEGCEGDVRGQGYCRKHYARLRRHGDPLGGGTYAGEAREFVQKAAMSDADECIVFPFYRNVDGYGRLNLDSGRYVGAHFYSCEIRNGPRPSDDHEARHSCGNGHEGCVNGNHLNWGRRKDNVHDAIVHGTAMFWGVPVSAYGAFRSATKGRLSSKKVQNWIAANDNTASQEAAA